MEQRILPNTALRVSRVCLGTMTFGSQMDEAQSRAAVDWCFDNGIDFFDTANVYNQGASEEILGRALKGRRQKAVLATKVRGAMGEAADLKGLSRAAIFRAVEDSLRRLDTDYLDIYYLHQPDYDVPLEESLAAMDRLVRAGKVRYPAASNYASWQMSRMHWIADKRRYLPAYVTQPMYNLLARGIEQEYVPAAKDLGLSLIVYNPLAGGLLTGKQTRERPVEGTRFDGNRMYLDRYWHGVMFDAVGELAAAAAQASRSLVSLSLNWLLRHTPADCVILGASRPEHLEANVAALGDGPLDEETLAACDAVWAKLRGVTPKYNR